IPVFRVFQHVSTALGLVGLAIYLIVKLRRAPRIELPPTSLGARAAFAACVAVGVVALSYRAIAILHSKDPGTLVVAPISGLVAGTLIASLVFRSAGERVRNHVMQGR